MKRKVFLISLFAMTLSLIAEQPLQVKDISMKVEALYWPKQKIKDSEKVADKFGYFELESIMEKCPATLLTDGKVDWNSSIRTYFWGSQPKRIEAIIDLGKVFKVSRVEVVQSGTQQKGNLIEQIEVAGGLENSGVDSWDTPKIKTQEKLMQPTENNSYNIDFTLDKEYRYIKVICSSKKSAMMILGEIRVFGEEVDQKEAILVPKQTARFEVENIDSTFKLNKPELIGAVGIFVTRSHSFSLTLPEDMQGKKLYSFLRYYDNGAKTVELSLNGKSIAMPNTKGKWKWERGPIIEKSGRVIACQIRKKKAEHGLVDSFILTADPTFDPAQNDNPMFLKKLVVLKKELPFAQNLLQENPNISPVDFARRIVEHHGIKYVKPTQVVDKYNNLLVNGKPFFQLGFYHVQPDDKRLDDFEVNTFITNSKVDEKWGKPNLKAVISHLASLRAYDEIVERLKEYSHERIAMHYICDEPDGHLDITIRDLELLTAVVKALCPDTVTFLNFAANSTMHKAFTITDAIGLDHYPIPAGRIADISYTMDAMRYFSGNRPVIFVPQAFSWEGYGRKDGRFPTEDELCAMTILGLIHRAKGILFYEFPAPKMSSKTSIKEINPKLWERMQTLIANIKEISPQLLGPDVDLPAQVIAPESARRGCFRLITNGEKKDAKLLLVNPWGDEIECVLDFSKGPLSGISLKEQMNYGVLANANNKKITIKMQPFASAIYDVNATGLNNLKVLTTKDVLAQLKPIFERPKNYSDVVLSQSKQGLDLLDSWRSLNRPDKAQLHSDEKGIYLDTVIRFPLGSKSICNVRDGRVWNDASVELFLSLPNSSSYVHLMVNTNNVQADWKFNPQSTQNVDKKIDYKWDSKVDYNGEVASFKIFIPWATLNEMIGAKPNDIITFNLASTIALVDWVGLTGSGFHAPARFGRIKLTDER